MTRVVLALTGADGATVAEQMDGLGVAVRRIAPEQAADPEMLAGADILVIPADPRLLSPLLLGVCDRARVRIVPVAQDDRAAAYALAHGVQPARTAEAREILAAASSTPLPHARRPRGSVTVVWGPHGAPGRSTVAAALAVELSRSGRVTLVDADTHAPSLALRLGLNDDGPGLAGACRQAGRSAFDAAESARITQPLPGSDGRVQVLVGLNRPERWPELREDRLQAVLAALGEWSEHIVIDVAAAIEVDEALLSDMQNGPRRNAATIAALASADRVIALTQADPVSIARFLRMQPELRRLAPAAPCTVAVNRLRPGAVGVDPRGQVRRTLDRFAGAAEVVFLDDDPGVADRALLQGTTVSQVAPRSTLAAAIRRLADAIAREHGAEATPPLARGRQRREGRVRTP